MLFTCVALSVALLSGCKSQPPNAAVVNGQAITLEDYNRYLQVKPSVQVVVDPSKLQVNTTGGPIPAQPYVGQVVGSLGLQAMSDLVQQTLLRQMAMDAGVMPSEQQVNGELDDLTKANPGFVRDRTSAGYSLPMIRSDVSLNLAQFNLVTQGIVVTDDDVAQYIKDHPAEFTVPESVDMVWILVASEADKAKVDGELKLGKEFLTVAQQPYNVAPNKEKLQYHFMDQYLSALAKYGPNLLPAVKNTAELHATDWIKFTEGWGKFYINKKAPARKVPIDDPMKKKVKRALMLQK